MSWALILLLSQDVQVEVEARAAWTAPKFRVRDGEPWLAPTSVFSKELDAESSQFNPGGAVRLLAGDERFSFGYWYARAEGDGAVEEPKSFGGGVVPAGTVSDTEAFFQYMGLGWRHRFALWEPEGKDLRLWLDPGLNLEYLVFDADLGFGGTRLDGVFPTPQLSAVFSPIPWLEVEAGFGGFYLPFVNGDVDILDPVQYRFSVTGRWDRWALTLGYELYHVHLEENANEPEEDVVHLRLGSWSLSLSYRF